MVGCTDSLLHPLQLTLQLTLHHALHHAGPAHTRRAKEVPMSIHPHHRAPHGLPRSQRSAIRSSVDALHICNLVSECASGSMTGFDTIVITLDDAHCGLAVITVVDTNDADALLVVLDTVAEAAATQPEVAALIVASIRPGGGFHIDDLARWRHADQSCADAGLDLIEWFVIGAAVAVPRAWCGDPERWLS